MSESLPIGRHRHPPAVVRDASRSVRSFAALLIVLALAGCAGAPIQEMSDARQTINAARDAGAENEVPGSLNRAEVLMNEAQRELELMNYKRARNDAVAAKVQAEKARMLAAIVAETRQGIRDIGADNDQTRRANELLQQSSDLAAQGDMTRALQLAREARRIVRLAR